MSNATALMPDRRRFAAGLAVAVLLHAALLTVPLRPGDRPGERLTPLRLALTAAARPEPGLERLPLPEPRASAEARPPDIPDRPTPSQPDRSPEPAAPASAPTTTGIDARALMDAVRELERGRTAPPRELGVFRAPAAPPNWNATPVPGENRFDGSVAPAGVRIVDRWLAADGSHNVVVETPAGETLCGRAEAWDPMRPLVEHVMQYRRCGGGGERSFEMPERYRGGR